MAENTRYIATEGERWDTIAYKAYGTVGLVRYNGMDVGAMELIFSANKTVPITEFLGAGVVLNIPVLDEPETSVENLPPWKR